MTGLDTLTGRPPAKPGVYVPIGCPRCNTSPGDGAWPLRFVSNHDSRDGTASRERRALLECTNPACRHAVLVLVSLIDVDNPGRTDGAAA